MGSGQDFRWTQESITEWSKSIFGVAQGGAREIAVRGNKEMAELLSALENGEQAKAAEECADVAIFLLQICEYLGADLATEIQRKMEINRFRKWKKAEDGSFQHVD